MTEIERLKEIKAMKNDPVKYPPDSESDYVSFIHKSQFNWLIEQAELSQELKSEREEWELAMKTLENRLNEVEKCLDESEHELPTRAEVSV